MTLGAPSGAFGAANGDQSGTESRMSTLIFPWNGVLMAAHAERRPDRTRHPIGVNGAYRIRRVTRCVLTTRLPSSPRVVTCRVTRTLLTRSTMRAPRGVSWITTVRDVPGRTAKPSFPMVTTRAASVFGTLAVTRPLPPQLRGSPLGQLTTRPVTSRGRRPRRSFAVRLLTATTACRLSAATGGGDAGASSAGGVVAGGTGAATT